MNVRDFERLSKPGPHGWSWTWHPTEPFRREGHAVATAHGVPCGPHFATFQEARKWKPRALDRALGWKLGACVVWWLEHHLLSELTHTRKA